MKWKTVAGITCAFGIVVGTCAFAQMGDVTGNMTNPSFETVGASPSPITGWIEFDKDSFSPTCGAGSNPWESSSGLCGQGPHGAGTAWCSQQVGGNPGPSLNMALAQAFPVAAGYVYEVSCVVAMSQNATPGTAQTYLRLADGDVTGSLDCTNVATTGTGVATTSSVPLCATYVEIGGQIPVYSSNMTVIIGTDWTSQGWNNFNICHIDDVTVRGVALLAMDTPTPSAGVESWQLNE